jgi:FkbM family methyltransferase
MNKIKRTVGFILAHPLAERHIVKSLCQFMIWQIQCTLSPTKLFVKPFVKPVTFYARKGLTGITGNIYVGLHEFNDMMFLLHFLRSEDTFFDVGANVGAYTLLASGVVRSKSIAIEPIESTCKILSKNLQLNQLDNRATPINSAAGAKMGMITFTSGQDTTNHVITENEMTESGTVMVPVISIDSLLNEKTAPSLMKIDVEGFETEVLKGAEATLNQSSLKAIIIELNGSGARYGYNEEEIHQFLISKGFRPFIYDPFSRTLSVLETYGHENTIYCRDLDFINRRLQYADAISIMGELI